MVRKKDEHKRNCAVGGTSSQLLQLLIIVCLGLILWPSTTATRNTFSLVSFAEANQTSAAPQPTPRPPPPPTLPPVPVPTDAHQPWSTLSTVINEARIYLAPVFYNNSFILIGGCANMNCSVMLNSVDSFDTLRGGCNKLPPLPISLPVEIDHLKPSLRRKLERVADGVAQLNRNTILKNSGADEATIAAQVAEEQKKKKNQRSSSKVEASDDSDDDDAIDPSLEDDFNFFPHMWSNVPTYQVTFAGYSTALAVGEFSLFSEQPSLITTRIWVVGACSLYIPNHQSDRPDPNLFAKYHKIWGLSEDLREAPYDVTLPDDVPLRANASCVQFGNRIYIVGGVELQTGSLLDRVDAFDVTYAGQGNGAGYIKNVFRHYEPVANAAVAIDNWMMYVVGGQRGCGEGGDDDTVKAADASSSVENDPHNTEDEHIRQRFSVLKQNLSAKGLDVGSEEVATAATPAPRFVAPIVWPRYCSSTRVTGYMFSEWYWYNESLPIDPVPLPANPYLMDTYAAEKFEEAKNEPNYVGPALLMQHLPRVFSFDGSLFVTTSATEMSVLNLSMAYSQPWKNFAVSYNEQQPAVVTHLSTIFAFPYNNNFEGYTLAFYSFGGFILGDVVVNVINERLSSFDIPRPLGLLPTVLFLDEFANFTLSSTGPGIGRLSSNLACYGDAAGTYPVPLVEAPHDEKARLVSFFPKWQSSQVYLCYSSGPINLTTEITGLTFYTVVSPYHQMSVIPKFHPQPKSGTSGNNHSSSHTGLIIILALIASLVVISIVVVIRLRTSQGSMADRLLSSVDGINYDSNVGTDATDSLVRNTTSDSRYRLIKRIGMGSFSTVYVVKRKQDNEIFALKFMICADDRERLEAIKECETINTIQGHPNIITLYDMFMNYEFGNKRESVLSEVDRSTLINQSMQSFRAVSQIEAAGKKTPRELAAAEKKGSKLTPRGGAADGPNGLKYSPRESGLDKNGSPLTPPVISRHTRYLCLVMEYHPGGDLSRFVLNNSPQQHDMRGSAPNNVNNNGNNNAIPVPSPGQVSGGGPGAPFGASPNSHHSYGSVSARSMTSSSFPSSPSEPVVAADDFLATHAISETALLSVAFQLCSVLNHLHTQKPPIVHRDLKPENVLLKGYPKRTDTYLPIVVTDFGLAFIQEDHRKSGKGGGTRPYISPESWKGQVSTCSDMWSFGCVLYAVATERLTVDTVRVMFLEAKSPTFREDIIYDLVSFNYTPEFAEFVASILVVDVRRRPTAAELLQRFSVSEDGKVVSLKRPVGQQQLVGISRR